MSITILLSGLYNDVDIIPHINSLYGWYCCNLYRDGFIELDLCDVYGNSNSNELDHYKITITDLGRMYYEMECML